MLNYWKPCNPIIWQQPLILQMNHGYAIFLSAPSTPLLALTVNPLPRRLSLSIPGSIILKPEGASGSIFIRGTVVGCLSP